MPITTLLKYIASIQALDKFSISEGSTTKSACIITGYNCLCGSAFQINTLSTYFPAFLFNNCTNCSPSECHVFPIKTKKYSLFSLKNFSNISEIIRIPFSAYNAPKNSTYFLPFKMFSIYLLSYSCISFTKGVSITLTFLLQS